MYESRIGQICPHSTWKIANNMGEEKEATVKVVEQEAQDEIGKTTNKSEDLAPIKDQGKTEILQQGVSEESSIMPRKELKSSFDRQARFYENGICLEETQMTMNEVLGVVKVRNIVYQKTVFARVTFDCWDSWKDVYANHLQCLPAETADLFVFNVNWQTCNRIMEFAVCCRQFGKEFWDNNNWLNFLLVRQQAAKSPKTLNETLDMAKLESKVLPVVEEEQKLPTSSHLANVYSVHTDAPNKIEELADDKEVEVVEAALTQEINTNLTTEKKSTTKSPVIARKKIAVKSSYAASKKPIRISPLVDAKVQLVDVASTSKASQKTVIKMCDVVEQAVEKTEEEKPRKDKKRIRAVFRRILKFSKEKK